MFVTFEGTDGAGKTTLWRWLTQKFQAEQCSVVAVREPGATPLGEAVRTLLLQKHMEPLTELFLFEAARAELVKTVIRPALQREDLVLCDRYIDSTVAYQGYGRGLNRNSLHMVNRIATEWLLPDLTILLDLDPAIGLARRQQSGEVNRFDDERVEFAKRIRDGFLQLVKQNPGRFVVLNAERDPETLQQMAYLEIKRRLPR